MAAAAKTNFAFRFVIPSHFLLGLIHPFVIVLDNLFFVLLVLLCCWSPYRGCVAAYSGQLLFLGAVGQHGPNLRIAPTFIRIHDVRSV
jgi:hypothetical protein